jgi:hypothetical protein
MEKGDVCIVAGQGIVKGTGLLMQGASAVLDSKTKDSAGK